MMKKIMKKLNSNSGVAIVLAMVFVMVVTMVVSVVLSTAVTASKNINYDYEQQQAYLVVSSAATYMRDQLSNGKLKINLDDEKIVQVDSVDIKGTNEEGEERTVDTLVYFSADETNIIKKNNSKVYLNCEFGPLLEQAADEVFKYEYSYEKQGKTVPEKEWTYKFTLNFDTSGVTEARTGSKNKTNRELYPLALQDVYVTFKIDEGYNILATLEMKKKDKKTGEEGNVFYRMTISLPCDKYDTDYFYTTADDETASHQVRVLSWAGGSVVKGQKLS